MHFLMMISDDSTMIYQTEMLIRSVKKFAPGPSEFSIVVNGQAVVPTTEMWIRRATAEVVPGQLKNGYISSNAEILFCPYHWRTYTPSRWFIKPKSETCVFIDADMLACCDLTPLYELDKNTVHGVAAFNWHLGEDHWKSLGLNQDEIQYYFNFGMLVVPAKYMTAIGNQMLDMLPKMLHEHSYHAGQISLALSLKKLGIPRNSLPNKFNWYDTLLPDNLDEIILLHYFCNRESITSTPAAFDALIPGNLSAQEAMGKIIKERSKGKMPPEGISHLARQAYGNKYKIIIQETIKLIAPKFYL
jgi:hypothetical protein